MKKTVSVNIKGTNFLIEEDAYELLQDYLDRLGIALQNEEGNQDIIEDIELRIAEICSTKLSDTKTVIELSEIEDILEALGDPSDYVDEDEYKEESSSFANTSQSDTKNDKRLFRDIHSGVLGGVCAGLANYFNIDVVIVRVAFVIFGFFAGFGFPLYIVLWLIIPRAESTIDRLRMKGRPITVETVKEEVEDAAERIKAGSKRFANRMRRDENYMRRRNNGRRIFRNILGIGFIGLGILFLLIFVLFFVQGFEFLPVKGDEGFMSISEYGELVLANPTDVKWMWIGGLLSAISAIVFLLSLGVILIFQLANKWTKLALTGLIVLGTVGGIICGVMGLRAGRDYASDRIVTSDITPKEGINTNELTILPILQTGSRSSNYVARSNHDFGWFGLEKNQLYRYGIDIEYVQTQDSVFRIKYEHLAYGKSIRIAEERASNIHHPVKIVGDSLFIDTKYYFPKKDKLRGQQVKLIVEIPEGKRVRLMNDVISFDDKLNPRGAQNYERELGVIESDGTYSQDYYDEY